MRKAGILTTQDWNGGPKLGTRQEYVGSEKPSGGCLGILSGRAWDRAPHHGLHHIGLVVPKRFGSKENIHQAVTADHLQDSGTGAEGAAAATPVAKGNTQEVWGRTWEPQDEEWS